MGSGLIGVNPYDNNAWSGSSRFFFQECARQGFLHRAFGVEVESRYRMPLLLRNFSLNKDVWRQNFYLDTRYYGLLSERLAVELTDEDLDHPLIQIGGIYDLKPRLPPTAMVYSYHDGNLAQALKSPYFPKAISKRKLQKALDYEKHVYENLDLIFTMSDYLKNSFVEDFGVCAEKVRTIGAGINLEPIPPARDKDYERMSIVFVGADFYRKGGFDVLKAFKQIRDVYPAATLDIVGPRKLVIDPDYASGVVYHGFLEKRDPYQRRKFEQILSAATLFVMPSLYEPFGIAPLEAMANQIPCILTNAWAFPEMIVAGINGELVEPGNIKELVEKMITTLKNPDKLKRMGIAGREMVLRKYTWESVVRNLAREVAEFIDRSSCLELGE